MTTGTEIAKRCENWSSEDSVCCYQGEPRGCEPAAWRATARVREHVGFLRGKSEQEWPRWKNIFSPSLPASQTNIALHVMQRQFSSTVGMSDFGGKVLPLVFVFGIGLLFPYFLLQHDTSLTAVASLSHNSPHSICLDTSPVLGAVRGSHQSITALQSAGAQCGAHPETCMRWNPLGSTWNVIPWLWCSV